MSHESNQTKRNWTPILAGALLSILLFTIIPNAGVQAASPAQAINLLATVSNAPDTSLLEKAYQREIQINKNFSSFLKKADNALAKLDAAIAEANLNGKDVASLKKARKSLGESITNLRVEQKEAARLLEAHAGFDAKGNVTDAKVAMDTVRCVSQIQRAACQSIGESIREAVKAAKEFHRDNLVQ